MTPGEYLAWAGRHGFAVGVTKCWLHERVPETVDADLLVVLGGHQCPATTGDECDYFDAGREKALGTPYSHRSVPSKRGSRPRGKPDPFFAAYGDTFLAGEWHNDMPGLTEDCAILAKSGGCPRQIVRYGKYVYRFQNHMEFTREIIALGIEEAGESLAQGGRFVQTKEQLLTFNNAQMNALLSSFLDAMAKDYEVQDHGSESLSISNFNFQEARRMYGLSDSLIEQIKATMQQAYTAGLIDDEVTWRSLLETNCASRYAIDNESAERIFQGIKNDDFPLFEKLKDTLNL